MKAWALLLSAPFVLALTQQPPQRRPEPTAFAPIKFFNTKCTYCHLKDGGSFDPQSLAAYTPKALEARLTQMTDQNAKSPLVDKDLDVLAGWVRSLGKGEPFVAWTELKDRVYKFEATDGATLTSSVGTIKLERGLWLLSGVGRGEWPTVTATKGRKKTVLKLSQSAISH